MKQMWIVIGLFLVGFFSLTGPAQAEQVKLKLSVSHPVVLAGKKQTAYIKIGLTGVPIKVANKRVPINVAIVLDRSGSMSGEKLYRAKQAAIAAIARLDSNDIVSVVAYDDLIRVVVPATRARDKQEIYQAIRSLQPGNTTALFAGVSRGAAEVRKFSQRNQVNRVILLSDGLANVGPSSSEALASLGSALAKEGISVTTLGLGLDYNEDLLVGLAQSSDGNHAFVESANDLERIFGLEFRDLLAVVAKEVTVTLRLPEGVRPLRVLGRDGEIVGQTVISSLKQIYGQQEKYVLVEVELPVRLASAKQLLASLQLSYFDLASQKQTSLEDRVEVRYSILAAEVEKSIQRDVMVAAVEQIANENSKHALQLRDQGLVEQARQALSENQNYVQKHAKSYDSPRLRDFSKRNQSNLENLDEHNWQRQRKTMRKMNYELEQQQAW